MVFPSTKVTIALLLTCFVINPIWAQTKKKITLQTPTHISAGWVALSDGTLFKCAIISSPAASAKCTQAVGLPDASRIEQLWGDKEYAWVTMSNGFVYGCHARFKSLKKREAPSCVFAEDLF